MYFYNVQWDSDKDLPKQFYLSEYDIKDARKSGSFTKEQVAIMEKFGEYPKSYDSASNYKMENLALFNVDLDKNTRKTTVEKNDYHFEAEIKEKNLGSSGITNLYVFAERIFQYEYKKGDVLKVELDHNPLTLDTDVSMSFQRGKVYEKKDMGVFDNRISDKVIRDYIEYNEEQLREKENNPKYFVIIDESERAGRELYYTYKGDTDAMTWDKYIDEDLFSKVLLEGNGNSSSRTDHKAPDWVLDTEEVIEELQYDLDNNFNDKSLDEWIEHYKENPSELFDFFNNTDIKPDKETIMKAFDVFAEYISCNEIYDDKEMLVDMANALYPDRDFCCTEIRGNVQSDWQGICYDTKEFTEYEIERLADFYFGNVAELYIEDEDHNMLWNTVVSESELWTARRTDALNEFVQGQLELSGEYLNYKLIDGDEREDLEEDEYER